MLLKKGANNRLLIYFFFDKQGIVDGYIDYMLEGISKCVKDVVVVSNGAIKPQGKEIFSKYTDTIIERENKGFDVWAYKEAMEHVGFDNMAEYDEIILMNYTIMGPIYPLQEMFDSMDERDIDYWGPTISHKTDFDPFGTVPFGYLPDHIQTHFLAIRASLFNQKVFRDYWRKMPMITSYQQSVGQHEAFFTKNFEDMGYKWEVYANSDEYRDLTYQPVLIMATEMIRDKKLPFFKRRSFMQDYTVMLSESVGQYSKKLFDYIDKETDYDVNMIWDNLLRVENMSDLKKNLQLNYILPTKKVNNPNLEHKKIALIMHMYFKDLIPECLHYAASMPEYADIYITTNTEDKKEAIEEAFRDLKCNKLDIRVTPNRGRDVGPFIVESREYLYDYDYICHTHDKKVGQLRPLSIGQSFSYRCFENVLATPEFVENVIDTFENNPRMGIIMPPPPNHSEYFFTLGLEWGANYEATCSLAKKLGIQVSMLENKEPISPLGSVFWARTDALRKIFDYPWTYEELPEEPVDDDGTVLHAIERMYSFSAQDMGYYAGWLFGDEGAQEEMTNMYYMLRTINDRLMRGWGICGSHQKVLEQMNGLSTGGESTRNVISACGTLYFAKDSSFNQNDIIQTYPLKLEDDRVEWKFEELDKYEGLSNLRIDPGEYKEIVLEDVDIEIENVNGSVNFYDVKSLKTNGVWIKNKLVFFRADPQIYINVSSNELIKSVTLKASARYGLDDELSETIMKKFKRF